MTPSTPSAPRVLWHPAATTSIRCVSCNSAVTHRTHVTLDVDHRAPRTLCNPCARSLHKELHAIYGE